MKSKIIIVRYETNLSINLGRVIIKNNGIKSQHPTKHQKSPSQLTERAKCKDFLVKLP
jgi:hypothetical protein